MLGYMNTGKDVRSSSFFPIALVHNNNLLLEAAANWMVRRAMSTLASTITNTLAVKPVSRVRGLEAFASGHLWTPYGARGVFGGQVVAQSVMAAIGTIKNMDLHSQHCYFLLPANSQVPITFTVERLRDGKSYATRLVHAQQDQKTVFILMASFSAPPRKLDFSQLGITQSKNTDARPDISDANDLDSKDEPGITASLKFDPPHSGESATPKANIGVRPFQPLYQKPFPTDITPFAQAIDEEAIWNEFLAKAKERGIELGKRATAVRSYIKERQQSPITISIARHQSPEYPTTRAIWIKPRLEKGETLTTNMVRALIAFMTDFQFIGTAARAVGLSGTSTPRLGMMASIDHTTHYYPLPEDFDCEAPLLHVMEAVEVDVASGRGFVRGEVYTESGHLIATTSQEGVCRAELPGIKPTRELDRNAKL